MDRALRDDAGSFDGGRAAISIQGLIVDSLFLFGKSVAMGLAIAAPLGPIGALCIQRTLARGFVAGHALQ